jgi:hypothetical protein
VRVAASEIPSGLLRPRQRRAREGRFQGVHAADLERARTEDANLARAYAEAPSWTDAASFDDRSVPFAVASLSYSRTVTDIVQAWFAAWRDCHGDLAGTPYQAAK